MESRLTELGTSVSGQVDEDETDRLVSKAEVGLKTLSWENKKGIVRDIIDKVVIYDGGKVKVIGHLPKFNQKVGYEFIGRICSIYSNITQDLSLNLNYRS